MARSARNPSVPETRTTGAGRDLVPRRAAGSRSRRPAPCSLRLCCRLGSPRSSSFVCAVPAPDPPCPGYGRPPSVPPRSLAPDPDAGWAGRDEHHALLVGRRSPYRSPPASGAPWRSGDRSRCGRRPRPVPTARRAPGRRRGSGRPNRGPLSPHPPVGRRASRATHLEPAPPGLRGRSTGCHALLSRG